MTDQEILDRKIFLLRQAIQLKIKYEIQPVIREIRKLEAQLTELMQKSGEE